MVSSTKSLVLGHIWDCPGTYRKKIAAHFGLHPNLVSDAVRTLIKERWVIEGGPKKSSLGRSPVALYLDSSNRAAFCVSYSSCSMTCGLVNAAGEILRSKTIAHNMRAPGAIVDLARQQFAGLKKKYKGIIIGTAVADPGMIDQRKGEVVRSSSFPGWRNIALAEMFNAKTGLETAVMDITCARAMAQYRILSAHVENADPVLYVDYDVGIVGFALLTSAGIWRGGGFAGEVGHVMIDPGGEVCRCGGRGCLENKTNSIALEKHTASLLEKGVDSILRKHAHPRASDIFSAAKNGDRFARTVIHDVLAELGLYVAIMAAACHPRVLVVGAETDVAISVLADEMKQAINSRLPSEIASTMAVVNGRPITPLGLIGAGLMMFEKVIQNGGK